MGKYVLMDILHLTYVYTSDCFFRVSTFEFSRKHTHLLKAFDVYWQIAFQRCCVAPIFTLISNIWESILAHIGLSFLSRKSSEISSQKNSCSQFCLVNGYWLCAYSSVDFVLPILSHTSPSASLQENQVTHPVLICML